MACGLSCKVVFVMSMPIVGSSQFLSVFACLSGSEIEARRVEHWAFAGAKSSFGGSGGSVEGFPRTWGRPGRSHRRSKGSLGAFRGAFGRVLSALGPVLAAPGILWITLGAGRVAQKRRSLCQIGRQVAREGRSRRPMGSPSGAKMFEIASRESPLSRQVERRWSKKRFKPIVVFI